MNVFTWGGDISLYNTLQNIKFFVADTFYLQAFIILCAFAGSLIATVKFAKDPIKTGIRNLFVAVILIQLFLTTGKTKVIIEDLVTNSALQVTDLPYGYSLLLSIISTFEYEMTKSFEKDFSTPNSLRINNVGLGYGMKAHLKMMEAIPLDDDILESFSMYYYNCIRPELYMKSKTKQSISTSDDILTSLEPTVAFETLVFENSNSSQVSCSEALAWLKPKIQIEAYKYLVNDLSASLGMNSSKIENSIGDMNASLYGISKNAKDTLTQAMMRNLLNYGEIESAKIIGADVETATYSAVQAREQTKNSWNVAGKQATENLPLMRIMYYNIAIGLFIFFSLLSAITSQYKYIGLGIGLLFSVSLWNPLGALLNSYYYSEMEEYINNLSYLGSFLTIEKMDLISEKSARILALLSNIYTYIPLIAMAIVTGSFMGLNAMASSTTGANVGGISNEVTKGNIDLGHTRIDSTTMGKTDVIANNQVLSNSETGTLTGTRQQTTAKGDTYKEEYLNDNANTVQSSSGAGKTVVNDNGIVSVDSAKVNSSIENATSELSEHSRTASTTASKEIANNLTEQLTNTTGMKAVETISNITGTSKETSQAIESSRQKALEKAIESSLTEEEKEQFNKIQDGKAQVTVGVGALGSSASVGTSLTLQDVNGNSKSMSLSSKTAEKLQEAYKENFAESLKENSQVMNNISKSVESGTSKLSSQAITATNSYNQAIKEEESYKQAISHAEKRGDNITTQVVEQAIKLQNPNFEKYSNEDKTSILQEFLHDINKGDKQALQDYKQAEKIVVSNYSNDISTNIKTPTNSVQNIEDNTNYSIDNKTPFNEFKENNSINTTNKPFDDTQNKITQGERIIENSNRADLGGQVTDWINEHSRPNGLNSQAIENTREALYGKETDNINSLANDISTIKNSDSSRDIKNLQNDLDDLSDKLDKQNSSKGKNEK